MDVSVLRIAHRAGNDLRLVPAALGLGADLIEADVQLYRGRLEVRHDRRRPGVPLQLAALTEALPDGATLMLDLKGWRPALGRSVCAAMSGSPPYVVCGRAWRMLDAFAGRPGVRVVHSVGSRRELAALPRRLARHATWGVAIHRELLSSAVVARLRQDAEVVLTWPINSQQDADDVVAMGVGGVISDDLGRIVLP